MTTHGIKSIVVLVEEQVKEGGMTWWKSLEGWATMLKKPLDNETWPFNGTVRVIGKLNGIDDTVLT